MSPLIVRRTGPKPLANDPLLSNRTAVDYQELELCSRRIDANKVEVWVASSPAGKMTERCVVQANAGKLSKLEIPFESPIEVGIAVGRALSQVLLPSSVYRLIQENIRRLDGGGLRIRLSLDPSLIDLPYEYVVRPEVRRVQDLSAFLFLDPKISLVRGAANRAVQLAPSNKPQRVLFLGTYWSGGDDTWGVEDEFNKLLVATRPIGAFFSMDFEDVVDTHAVARELKRGAAIVHYSGHSDADARGHYLVREGGQDGGKLPWYADDFAKAVADAGARVVVLSACNSGAKEVVEPLLKRGVAAVIGMYGLVASESATVFCEKLYGALAVGLSIDEAVTYARAQVAHAGVLPCDWGMPMVYLATRNAVIFPRPGSRDIREHQQHIREARSNTIESFRQSLAELDDDAFAGIVISELAQKQVLILGRFKAKRKAVLDALRKALKSRPEKYRPTVFDFEVPKGRRLGESVLTMAGLSRFVIADLTDPASIPAELEKIVLQCRSVPVQPLLVRGRKPYAVFEDLADLPNVLDIVYYDDIDDLLKRLDTDILPQTEARAGKLRKRRLSAKV